MLNINKDNNIDNNSENIILDDNLTVSLTKFQKVSLKKKNNAHLKEVQIGLSWKRNPLSKRLDEDFDADLSFFMVGANGRVKRITDFVFYGNPEGTNQSIIHLGDNLTGNDEDDDEDAEQANIYFDLIPNDVKKIYCVVTINECIEREQTFGLIKDASITIREIGVEKPLLRCNLTEDYSIATALRVCEFDREGDGWAFDNRELRSTKEQLGDICMTFGIKPE